MPVIHKRLTDIRGLLSLTDTTVCADPQTVYRRLQEKYSSVIAPVELVEGVPAWLVTGYWEAVEVLRNERLFAKDPNHWSLYQRGVVPPSLGAVMYPRDNAYFVDGDVHRRLRKPLDDALAAVDTHRLRHQITDTCMDLIGQFSQHGRADLMVEYASAIPTLGVAAMFGIPGERAHPLRAAQMAVFGSGEDAADGIATFEQILHETVQAHKRSRRQDMTTAFLDHPHLANDYEVMQAMSVVFGAAYQTTITWIASTLRLMLTDTRFSQRLRGGRIGVDGALDEVLWRDPPMANFAPRYALADCELAGQPISRGDALILAFAAAHRDPRARATDPYLEIGNQAHLAFSAGPHSCPAKQPGRLIARTAVEIALHELHEVHLEIRDDEVPLLPAPWTRCPASLPVQFTPHRGGRQAASPR